MKITYSPTADAVAIDLVEAAKSASTRELGGGINLDYDEDGRLIGIEILDASRHYPRKELEQHPSPVEYMTLAEAAKESKLSTGTLKAQIHNERLPAIKRGRDWLVARHDLWTYLENRAPQGAPAKRRAARRQKVERVKASA